MANARNSGEQRPSPDALLEAARSEDKRSGKLRIFVGAAPGVGKTYEMLQSAHALKKDGYDVVIGIVEPHGRKDTEALVEGLDVIPRQRISYRGRMLEEMDLDAIIARRPQIVLVDELAHSNLPGSRHPKRYLDVEELLSHGISVYTTVNIQHIESLNDVVAQITHVRVRETVPDWVFDRADAVELIDLTPDDLIQRLKEGKVYVPRQAQRALAHFFSPANLTALRELALRRTADRVDAQLLTQMRAGAIPGPWAAGERVLVCVTEDPRAAGLVRYAKRIADRLHCQWTALYVEGRRSLQYTEVERDRVADTLRLAEKLGGQPVTIPSSVAKIADDLIAYAESHNVTHIVLGKSNRSRWFEMVHGSVVHDLVRRSGNISVHVIAGDAGGERVPRKTVRTAQTARTFDPRRYAVALAIIAVAVGVSKVLQDKLHVQNVDLVFLTAVVGIAVRYGLLPSLLASLAASLSYNFIFMPHDNAFTLPTSNVVAFFFFFTMAVIVSNVAARARAQALSAVSRARTTESLYAFSRKLSGAGPLDDVLWATTYQAALMLNVRVVVLLPEDDTLAVRAGYPPEDSIDDADLAAARWAWQNNQAAGRGSDTLPGARRLFLPMRTGRGRVGVVGLDSDKAGPLLTPDGRRLLDALMDQAALAVERVRLVEDLDRAKRTVETDRLRSALLTSISHDLKTPLSGILGAASTLRGLSGALSEQAKSDLLATIIDESERLNRFIGNLLDMTRLESGAVAPNASAHDLVDVVGTALERARKILAGHKVEVHHAASLPMVEIDPVLFEQVLFNLLDNAAKYAPSGSTVRIQTWRDNAAVGLQVLDEGDGILPADLEQIFDKFYRARKVDRVRAGTGLGLAISRGFIEAMHGTITAGNRSDRTGAVFTIRLPVPSGAARLEPASHEAAPNEPDPHEPGPHDGPPAGVAAADGAPS